MYNIGVTETDAAYSMFPPCELVYSNDACLKTSMLS
jgi:hypothetical protein